MKYVFSGLTALMAFSTANAAEWETKSFTQKVEIRENAANDFSYDVLLTRSTDENRPEIRFSCSQEKGLVATIITRPVAEQNARLRSVREQSINYRTKSYTLRIDGREPFFPVWTRVKELQLYQTRDFSTAAKIFNAVVQGKGFEISRHRIDPSPIDDGFREFASKCHKTNGSGKTGPDGS
ncbi:MAG: hypothetical protein MRY59_04675 [Aquisalinus sp.]|nr:hypothetical protein [Aquisalinus sp.]